MKLALGTAQFGLPYGVANQVGQLTASEASEILAAALAGGVDTIDTAIAYGDSEVCLGDVGLDDFRVVTKLPYVPDDVAVAVWINEQFHASLRRLRLAKVYALLLHCPQQLLGKRGKQIVAALEELKAMGLIQKFGISIYAPEELEAIFDVYSIDLVQAPLSLIDRRLVESGWLKRLVDSGVEVHARSVFLQGLLLMPLDQIPDKFARWQNLWRTWQTWQIKHPDASAAQACIRYVADLTGVERVIVGVDSLGQFKELLAATNLPLKHALPEIASRDLNLVHPSNWNQL